MKNQIHILYTAKNEVETIANDIAILDLWIAKELSTFRMASMATLWQYCHWIAIRYGQDGRWVIVIRWSLIVSNLHDLFAVCQITQVQFEDE